MMKKMIVLVALCLAALGNIASAADGQDHSGPCDLANVVKGFYCEIDDAACESSELVSDVVYFECSKCATRAEAAGQCSDCEVDLEKKTSGKNVCMHCMEAPRAVEICIKSHFACEGCGHVSAVAAHCDGCDKDLAAQVSKSLVTYECPECGETEYEAGSCTNDDCTSKGKALARVCAQSGRFPHATAAAADSADESGKNEGAEEGDDEGKKEEENQDDSGDK